MRSVTSEGLGWKVWAPLLILLILLVALWLVPAWIDHQASVMRRRTARRAEAVHAQIYAVTAQLALMAASARGFALTADERFREDYCAAAAAQDRSLVQLWQAARSLDARLLHQVVRLGARTDNWEAVSTELVRGEVSRDVYLQRLPQQQEQLRALLASLAALEVAVGREASRDAADIQRFERQSLLGTGALTALVILTTLSLFLIARRFRELAVHNADLAAVAEQRRQLVEQAVQSRAELLRGVSHDVQNPIGGASLLLELLQEEVEGPLNSQQQHTLASARRSLGHASAILREIMELTQAEAGTLRIKRAPVDLQVLLLEGVADSQKAATAAGLRLTTELAEDLPVVRTDAQRVRRILDNFLSNAIKYTPRGGQVEIGSEHRPHGPAGAEEAESWVKIQVRDSGPGIAPDAVGHIFTEGYRVPGTQGRGTGIGLAISRKVARLLGGEITVESEIGRGSSFTLWIPVQ